VTAETGFPLSRAPGPDPPGPGRTPDWLALRARALPSHPALVAGSLRWSFGELDGRATRTARQLTDLGVGSGTPVAVLLRNGAPFVVLTHALARVGAVMAPLNVRLAEPELARQLEALGAPVLVCDHALAPLAEAAARELPDVRLVFVDALAAGPGAGAGSGTADAASEPRSGASDRLALSAVQGIIHTSATTGRPKGVQLTFGNHWWSAIASALNLGHQRNDRWLASLPLYHVGGFAILWRSVICGIPMVIHEAFDPEAMNRGIDEAEVTLVSVVPTMLQRLLDARGSRPFPGTLRCVLLGGAPAPRALIETCLRLRVPVAPTYGLTETASQVATLAPEEVRRKPGSVGKALFPSELRIDREGIQAPPGEVGEILVRGPTVMRGYARRPGETARALRDGWLYTGDLGYLDGDGYLYVVERRDDLIISGGENVYPAEVEMVLKEHPAIEDAGVIGLPDATWGQVVAAAVKLRTGSDTNEDEVRAFCDRRLAGYKVPARVWFVDALPRSAAGKLSRQSLRQWGPAFPRTR
jgi:o-succinylbenzoate---CoA ligase